MKKILLASITFAAMVLGGVAFSATAANATEAVPCLEADASVIEQGTGSGTYLASATVDCGVWLVTYTFDNDYIPVDASDYGHPQTIKEWAWIVLHPEGQIIQAIIPECGPYQTDVHTGADFIPSLSDGDIGEPWIAGSVGVRPLCEVMVPPVEPPVVVPPTEPPVVEAPVVETPREEVITQQVSAKVDTPKLAETGVDIFPLLFLGLLIIVIGGSFKVYGKRKKA